MSFKRAIKFLLMMALVPLIDCQPRPNRQGPGPPIKGLNLNARGPGLGPNRMGGPHGRGPNNPPNGPLGRQSSGLNGPPGPLNPHGPRGPLGKGHGYGSMGPNMLNRRPNMPNRRPNNRKGNLGNFNVEYQTYDSLDDSEINYYPKGNDIVSVESNGAADEDYFPHDLENDRVQVIVDEKSQLKNKQGHMDKKLYYSGPNPAEMLDLNVPPMENRIYEILKTENDMPKPQNNLRIEQIHHNTMQDQQSKEFPIINNNNIANKIEDSKKIGRSSLSQSQENDNKELGADIGPVPREKSKDTAVYNQMNNDLVYHDYKVKESNPGGEINYDIYDANSDDNSNSPGRRSQKYSADLSFFPSGHSGESHDHTKDEDFGVQTQSHHNAKIQFDTENSGEFADHSNDINGGVHSQNYNSEMQFNPGYSGESADHSRNNDPEVRIQSYSAETQFNPGHSGDSADHTIDAGVHSQNYNSEMQFNTGYSGESADHSNHNDAEVRIQRYKAETQFNPRSGILNKEGEVCAEKRIVIPRKGGYLVSLSTT